MSASPSDVSGRAHFQPLRGIRVVDMADEKAELAGRLLADLGADVVRVEPPGGASSRRLPPFHEGTSLYFEVRNTNKRATVIDLDDDAGRQKLIAMLERADIWIETGRPGHLAALGLDPRGLVERFPQLIALSVSDFGQTGPYRDFVATDAVMEGMAWMLFRAGVPHLPPVLPPGSLAYDMVGAGAAFAALTAYLDRCGTGLGQYIDMSVMEAVAQLTDWGITSYSVISKLGTYGEIRDGGGKVYPILPCRDGYVRASMVTVAEWRKWRAWLIESGVGREVLDQDYWDESRTRIELFDELLRPLFVEFFRDKTMLEVSIEGQKRHIPVTPMLSPAEVLEADQFRALGSFTDGELSSGSRGRFASGFLAADGQRVGYRQPAPAVPSGSTAEPGWPPAEPVPADPGAEPGRPYRG
ncbi:MAG TPA: CoA transferase, partial [Acidimicrobiales bacterium]|nr:CoA transferase [Acidimicrobiales bacterium]